jgi:hypothetical protein
MDRHVKIAGWLWIVNGVLTILMAIAGLIIVNLAGSISNPRDSMLINLGSLCFFLPGIIAAFVAGFGLLKTKAWSRILAIILSILNLILFPTGTAVGVYTLWVMLNTETKALFVTEN